MIYFNAVHVKAEDFLNKPVSDARSWASDHKLKFELQQEYSMEYDANRIISQSVPEGKRIRKGKTFTIVSSTGPDPEDIIPMPDFSEMNRFEIDGWIEENKAINVNIITEFSDKVDEGNFIRLVFRDSSVTEETYRRRDSVTIYVSRGVEVFEKNIAVPDFIGKTRAEVEQWAETNSIEVTFEEEHSNEIMMDTVISQSIAAEEKIAKMDKMKVVISLGKAIVVPNFASLTMDEASAQPDLMVTVQQRYHAEVPFGGLISQSISAGTKLTDKDNLAITVIYSEGRPFLKDYRGLLEGDLPSIFYQDYQSKGANIKYTVKYVDAPEIKGTVVGMSKFNEFVPMNFTVEIRVSKNASPQSHQPQPIPPDIDFDEPIETGDELPKNKDE
ncbi:MAG: PASTA domain-containing protein [Bacillaceae bacterium]|nr:PASTA domain-containing protein [Bacillaceae bacterium]